MEIKQNQLKTKRKREKKGKITQSGGETKQKETK